MDSNKRTLWEILEHCAGIPGRGIHFIDGTQTVFLSYEQLLENACKVLTYLSNAGVKEGDELIIQTEDNQTFLTVFWACIAGKIIAVPVSGGGQPETLRKPLQIMRQLGNPWIFCDQTQQSRLYGRADEAAVDFLNARWIDSAGMMSAAASKARTTAAADDLAYIQFSSGSTGQPKGVMLTQQNLITNITDIAERTLVKENDHLLSWMPLTHDMGLICFHLTGICAAAAEYLISTSAFIRRPLLWMESADRYRATVLYSPNFGLEYFLSALDNAGKLYDWDLSCIRLIYNGAEMISPALCFNFVQRMQNWGMPLYAICPGYGLAEASVAVTLCVPGEPLKVHYFERQSFKTGTAARRLKSSADKDQVGFVVVGTPIRHCEVRITGDHDEILAEGYSGHIQIRGGNVTAGYYRDAVRSAELFTTDGWLRTGDLGMLLEGELLISGRYKNMLIMQGLNYYPHDIERICMQVEGITTGKVVACGYRDENAVADQLLIFVLFKGNVTAFEPVAARIRKAVLTELAIPVQAVIPVSKIPKTTSGKIQHFKLLEAYLNDEYRAVEADGESSVAAVLTKEIFNELYSAVTASDDLNEVPVLSSLQALQFSSGIKKRTGLDLPLQKIFEHSQPSRLFAYLQTLTPQSTSFIEPAAPKELYSLNPSQHRIWMLQQLAPGGDTFNINAAYKLQGTVDIPVLSAAFDMLVQRHTSLRSAFIEQEGVPYQFIKPVSGHLLETVIATDGYEKEITAFARQPFNLATDTLLRARLVKLNGDEWLLLINIHHIIADGWSLGLLIKEIQQYYLQGTQSPPLAFQFKDYCEWLVQNINNGTWKKQELYWQEKLHRPGAAVSRALSVKDSVDYAFEGSSFQDSFSVDLTQQLRELAYQHQCTPFSVLLSLLYLTLYKYSGQKDVVVAVAHAGRNHFELEDQIGCFMKLLPVRIRLDASIRFSDLLMVVHRSLQEALVNQDYPAGNSGPAHLFDILALYQEFQENAVLHDLGKDINILPLHTPAYSSATNLQFEWWTENAALQCRISYNTALFEAGFIQQLQSRYISLVKQVCADPLIRLRDGRILGEAEEQQLLYPAAAAYDSHLTLLSAFEKQVKASPDSIAVSSEGRHISYLSLYTAAQQLALALREQYDVGQGDPVALLLPRNELQITAILAIFYAGGVLVPLDMDLPEERINTICADSGVKLVLTEHTYRRLSQVQAAAPGTRYVAKGSDIAYILYTSGSTGRPKGVIISHASLADYVHTFSDYFKITAADVVIQQSSLSFDTAFEEIFPALCSGARLVTAPSGNFDIPALMQLMQEEKVTVLSTTPLVLNEINKLDELPSSWRLIISGGDLLKLSQINRLLGKYPLYNTYGPTETTICVSYHKIENAEDVSLIGKPIPHHIIYILDDALNPVIPSLEGEICIAGAGVAQGYLNRHEQTAERFVPNPYAVPGYETLYRTGDRGRWRADGLLEFLGRKDDQAKIRGYRIEPEEIDRVLESHPDVIRAYTRVWEKATDDAQLLCYYTATDESCDARSVLRFLQGKLPYYMIPSSFIRLDVFPLNKSGKTDVQSLPLPASEDGFLYRLETGEASPMAAALIRLWEQVLDQQDIQLWDHFFEKGGNSITATRLIGLINKQLKRKASLKDVFSNPTVYLMAECLEALPEEAYTGIPRVAESTGYALSFLQRNIWSLCQDEEASVAYNETETLRITGDFSGAALREAFIILINRHEILRTAFTVDNGEPLQRVQSSVNIDDIFSEIDLRQQDAVTETVDAIIREDAYKPFKLDVAPLLRIKIIIADQQQYILVMTVHHLISDGWSVRIFVNELSLLYNGILANTRVTLPALPVQYRDFAVWQTQRELSDDRKYWTERLQGFNAVVELPFMKKRSTQKSYWGKRAHFILDKNVNERLKGACLQYSVGTLTYLLTVLKTLFYRYSGQEDITTGVAVSGREQAELTGQIGLYLNTLALRTQVQKELRFEDLLQNVNETLTEALLHQSYPAYNLAEETGGTLYNGNGLFNVMLVMENEETEVIQPAAFNGAQVKRYKKVAEKSRFDLVFFYEQGQEQLYVDLEYDTDVFTAEGISAIFSHFETLLKSALENGQQLITKMALVPEPELSLLQQFNNTAKALPDSSLVDLFEKQVAKRPDATAVFFEEQSYTFRELNEAANRIAHLLRSAVVVAPGTLVVLLLDRSFHMLAAIWGVVKSGAAYVPVDPGYPEERVRYILKDTEAVAVLTSSCYSQLLEKIQWQCPALSTIICLDMPADPDYGGHHQEAVQLWNYTSDEAFNEVEASGWKDSRSGQFFTPEDMQEMVDNVIGKVKPFLSPDAAVLEIGAGSGLITAALAPSVGHYTATDISEKVLDRCRVQMSGPAWAHVLFKRMTALEIAELAPAKFDVIIVNSVLQYFPSYHYARTFIRKAISMLKPNSVLLLGDIRDQALQSAYYNWRFDGVETLITEAMRKEEELFYPAAFFTDYFPEVEVVSSKKAMSRENELSLFRYDVLIKNAVVRSSGKGKQLLYGDAVAAHSTENLSLQISGDDLAYVIYTSGSSGAPKGAMLAHRGVVNRLKWMWEAYEFSAADIVLQKTTYVFDVSVWEIFMPACFGCAMVLCQPQRAGDPEAIIGYIEKHGVTVMHFVPGMLPVFMNAVRQDLPSLRCIFTSGEALTPEAAALVQRKLSMPLHNLYGPTEASVDVTAYTVNRGDERIPIGRPIDNVKIYITDVNGGLLPVGVKGEIRISGIALAKGYLNKPTLSAERFIENPFTEDPAYSRLYRTGDIGYWLPDGNIIYEGRGDAQVKLRGFRIEPGEIESRLRAHAAVADAVVMMLRDPGGDDYLAAAVLVDKENAPVVAKIIDMTAADAALAKTLTCLPNGLSLFQQNEDETGFLYTEIFEQQTYLRNGISIKPGDTVFDIGANIGLFSLFAGLSAEDLSIYAFEPVSQLFGLLEKNMALYGINAHLFACALGREEGMVSFTYYPYNSVMSGRYADLDRDASLLRSMIASKLDEDSREVIITEKMYAEQQLCQVKRLSDVIRENNITRIDLLKIDVEKSEGEILFSIAAEDWPKIQQVVVEVESIHAELEQILSLLTAQGFTVVSEKQDTFDTTAVFNVYATRHASPAATVMPAVYRSGIPQLDSDVKAYCNDVLPYYMVPSRFLYLTAMPLTINGKVNRAALQQQLLAENKQQAAAGSAVLQGPVEQLLAEIWKEVLDHPFIERSSNFFEIGGHSLKAVKVIAAINRQLQIKLPVSKLFRFRTIQLLAAEIEKEQKVVMHPVMPAAPQPYYPLSDAQLRFWMMHQLEDNRVADNMPGAVLLEGMEDSARMSAAFKKLIERHESLRTTFITVAGQPYQQVHDAGDWPFELELIDLSEHAFPDTIARKMVREQAAFRFDLYKGPLVKALLLKLAAKRHVLLFNMHHIIADGQSMEVLLADLVLYYNAAEPEPLPFQYKDYLLWQQEHEKYDEQAASRFWMQYLRPPVPRMLLKTDYERGPVLSSNGDFVSIETGELLYRQLLLKSRQDGISMYVIMLTAVNLLLSHVTGQSDIIVGSPVNNRDHFMLDRQIGNFLNILPLRTSIYEEETFNMLLSRCSEMMISVMEQRQYPFNRIVQDLALPRDASRNILFDVGFTFNYRNNLSLDGSSPLFDGLKAGIFDNGYRSVKSDIWINCTEGVRNMKIMLEYNTDLFRKTLPEQMAQSLCDLVEAALKRPEMTLLQLKQELTRLAHIREKEQAAIKRSAKFAGLKADK